MAAESAVETIGNGNIPKEAQPPAQPAASKQPENIFVTIALTIYDVIVFLAVSIGYIFQVS